ncbi:LysE family translocator [Jonesiaceae bacterium BS-20]|uniref:LysE family translocator n=1 Tax=Jonesiaceae bacterium BS-20 TaxID=3120821 RepID=A0AAU7DUA0_9MICO
MAFFEGKAGVVRMDPSIIGAFWVVSFLFIMSPGADWAYAIAAGIGGRRVTPAVSGMLAGHGIAILLVAAGLGAVLARTPSALIALTVAGAAYLFYLGVGMIRTPATVTVGQSQAAGTWGSWASRGLLVSGLNPKVFLLLLALLPQFTDASGSWGLPTQMLTLGGIHLVGTAIVYFLVGFGAQAIMRTRPGLAMWISRFSGLAMVGIAIFLLVEQVLSLR